MPGGGRPVWRIAFQNFINSFRIKQIRGNHIGKDYIGNVYYEIPADPSGGKRKPTRWYDPAKGMDFQDPLPSEWESWLRMRRLDPPSEEEISKNQAVAEMKKVNAQNIELKRLADGGSIPSTPAKGQQSFPTYSEYSHGETIPKK